MSDRIFAIAWLAFCAGVAWLAWQFETTYSYEPIGPRAFPLMLCAMMAASAGWLLAKPGREPDWPRGALRVKIVLLVGVFLLYAGLFEWLGFPVATGLVVVAIGRLYEGRWGACAAGGAVMGAGFYFFFDKLLDVTLPLGRLWTGG
jgi:putative tricarboxylic transport membrane protein